MEIFIGNLHYDTTSDDLRACFERYGKVDRANVVMDRETGKSRGFGFVTMMDIGHAKTAIETLDGSDLDGRTLKVNEARPKADRGSSGRREYRDKPGRRG